MIFFSKDSVNISSGICYYFFQTRPSETTKNAFMGIDDETKEGTFVWNDGTSSSSWSNWEKGNCSLSFSLKTYLDYPTHLKPNKQQTKCMYMHMHM